MAWKSLFFVICVNAPIVLTHFISGTVSWESSGNPLSTQVIIHGKYGFTNGPSPGCGSGTQQGAMTTGLVGGNNLACTGGCFPATNISGGDLNYYCGSWSKNGYTWEQGDEFLIHSFPSAVQYIVSYSGDPWIPHDYGTNGNVYLQTTINLGTRSDTSRPNSSPVTSSFPVYTVPFDCVTGIQIPVYDPDDDIVACRWAAGVECGGVCNGLPQANLDNQRCILTIQPLTVTGFKINGTYIVTLTVEDFPKSSITVGGSTVTSNQSLSQIPLQFVIHTVKIPGQCTDIPQITNPTTKNGQVFIVPAGQSFSQKVYASYSSPATKILYFALSVPYGMGNSTITHEGGQTYSTELTWKPVPSQYSPNVLCFQAVDDNGLFSSQHCFTLRAGVDDPCAIHPCEHGGSCAVELDTYKCNCTYEYEGRNCSIDVNDCLSSPCKHGGTCWDQIGGYQCFCPVGFIGPECQDIDHCATKPCLNFGSCTTNSTGYSCTCSPGFSGNNCQTELNECASNPCENNGICTDMVGDFFCECPIEYKGKNCSEAHDFCDPNPCEHNGVCTNYKDSYRCSCPSGYIGLDCEIYQPDSCGSDDDNHCMCLLNGRRVKLPFPQQKSEGFSTDDLIAGIVGLPIGLAVGAFMCVIWHKLLRPRCFSGSDTTRPPRSRPSSTSSSTKSLISRDSRDSTASPSDIRASVHSPVYSITPTPVHVNPYRPNLSTSDWH